MNIPGTITKFLDFIKISCKANNEVSSTRITSFIILCAILAFVLYFITIGVCIAVSGHTILIPNELMIVFGSLLAHQLTLLGINKYNETKQLIGTQKKDDTKQPDQPEIPITPINER